MELRRTVCGLDELPAFRGASVTHVLSILDPGMPEPQDFGHYDPHERLTLHFHDIIEPLPDMVLPTLDHVETLLDFGQGLAGGHDALRHLLVHCHMGVSRSTAAMATLLVQAQPRLDADAVFEHVLQIRPQAWPNSRLIALADERLSRGGALTRALARLYARQLRAQPQFGTIMRQLGREAEVDMAEAA